MADNDNTETSWEVILKCPNNAESIKGMRRMAGSIPHFSCEWKRKGISAQKWRKWIQGCIKESDHDEETRRRDQREYRLFLF